VTADQLAPLLNLPGVADAAELGAAIRQAGYTPVALPAVG